MKAGESPYDVIAAVYDQPVHREVTEEFFVRAQAATTERFGGLRGLRVLDVGCGTGILARMLADHGALVVGLDPSAGMLAVARLTVRELGSRVHLLRASLLHSPLVGEFQLVVACQEVLNQWPGGPQLVLALTRLRDCLSSDGLLVFDTLTRENFELYWDDREWREGTTGRQLWMGCAWDPHQCQGVSTLTAVTGNEDARITRSSTLVQYWHPSEEIEAQLAWLGLSVLRREDWNPGTDPHPNGFVDRHFWVATRSPS